MATKQSVRKDGKKTNHHKTYHDPNLPGRLPGVPRFAVGNPGRPKGVQNHKTRIINSLLSCWDEEAAEVFRAKLRHPRDQAEALETLLQILGKGKVESLFGDVHIEDNSVNSSMNVSANIQQNIQQAKSILANRTPAEREALQNLLKGMGMFVEVQHQDPQTQAEEVQEDGQNQDAGADSEGASS